MEDEKHDIFRRESQWIEKRLLGDAGEEQNKPKWTRVELMMFLRDVICSRKTEGNIFLPVVVIEDSDTST